MKYRFKPKGKEFEKLNQLNETQILNHSENFGEFCYIDREKFCFVLNDLIIPSYLGWRHIAEKNKFEVITEIKSEHESIVKVRNPRTNCVKVGAGKHQYGIVATGIAFLNAVRQHLNPKQTATFCQNWLKWMQKNAKLIPNSISNDKPTTNTIKKQNKSVFDAENAINEIEKIADGISRKSILKWIQMTYNCQEFTRNILIKTYRAFKDGSAQEQITKKDATYILRDGFDSSASYENSIFGKGFIAIKKREKNNKRK